MHKKGGTYVLIDGKEIAVQPKDRAALFEKRAQAVQAQTEAGPKATVPALGAKKSTTRGSL